MSSDLIAAMDRRTSTIVVAGRSTDDAMDVGTGRLPRAGGDAFVLALSALSH